MPKTLFSWFFNSIVDILSLYKSHMVKIFGWSIANKCNLKKISNKIIWCPHVKKVEILQKF